MEKVEQQQFPQPDAALDLIGFQAESVGCTADLS